MTSGTSHFQTFGLEPCYELDLAVLDSAYERLSLANHPDFFANAGEARQQEALRASAALNEGYRVLRSEPLRAAHLLGLWSANGGLDTAQLPAGFLPEMFSLQEQVDDLEATPDPALAAELKQRAAQALAQTRQERAALFGEAEGAPPPQLLQRIQTNLNQDKYLQRLMARL